MKYVPLNPSLPSREPQTERTEEAAIVGEIARHLLDMRETTSATRVVQFVSKLNALVQVEPEAFWLVVRIMSGDLSEVTRSYSEIGRSQGMSKQAAQQRQERVLRALHAHYPEVERALVSMLACTADYMGERKP